MLLEKPYFLNNKKWYIENKEWSIKGFFRKLW